MRDIGRSCLFCRKGCKYNIVRCAMHVWMIVCVCVDACGCLCVFISVSVLASVYLVH
jgi:hypothetical protein